MRRPSLTLSPVIAIVATGLMVSACCPSAYYEVLTAEPRVRLPLDEAPHCYGAEWWYYTGRLTAEDGRAFGIEAVIFHVPHLVLLPSSDVWVSHFAVLDVETGSFTYDQNVGLETTTELGPEPGGFDLATERVRLTGSEGLDVIRARTSDGQYDLALQLVDQRGPALHGENGYVPFGADGASFYYSRPRMSATGTLTVDGEALAVDGTIWFDRQWGRALPDPHETWDWFSIRLDDATDVMLFVFRDEDNPVALGSYMTADGVTIPLTAADFQIDVARSWTSPHTGITYPVGWHIEIVPFDLRLRISAVADDQELDVRTSTLNIYWEGLCDVTGTRGSEPVMGDAYVELTNYDR